MSQSKQVSAPASRSILNYRLTCGFFASVLRSDCTEKGQPGGFGGSFTQHRLDHAPQTVLSGGLPPRKNPLDLIRRAYSVAPSDFISVAASGQFMQSLRFIFALVVFAAVGTQTAAAPT